MSLCNGPPQLRPQPKPKHHRRASLTVRQPLSIRDYSGAKTSLALKVLATRQGWGHVGYNLHSALDISIQATSSSSTSPFFTAWQNLVCVSMVPEAVGTSSHFKRSNLAPSRAQHLLVKLVQRIVAWFGHRVVYGLWTTHAPKASQEPPSRNFFCFCEKSTACARTCTERLTDTAAAHPLKSHILVADQAVHLCPQLARAVLRELRLELRALNVLC